jgi:ribosome-associated heat shock protein Hsp15
VSDDGLRLDRWLWFARFYKTRTAASDAVQGGHVRVNDEPAKASSRVRIGDRIRLVRQQLTWELEVRAIPARRGPASEAQSCYEESAESVSRREQTVNELRRDRLQQPMTRGKPDKRTRRLLRTRKGL